MSRMYLTTVTVLERCDRCGRTKESVCKPKSAYKSLPRGNFIVATVEITSYDEDDDTIGVKDKMDLCLSCYAVLVPGTNENMARLLKGAHR